jgi:hypothetical protein
MIIRRSHGRQRLASPADAFVTGQNIVIDGGTLISD